MCTPPPSKAAMAVASALFCKIAGRRKEGLFLGNRPIQAILKETKLLLFFLFKIDFIELYTRAHTSLRVP